MIATAMAAAAAEATTRATSLSPFPAMSLLSGQLTGRGSGRASLAAAMRTTMGTIRGAENFETDRSPRVMPSPRMRAMLTRCASIQNAPAVARNRQQAVMSLVTRAPLARTVGQKANRVSASSPPAVPWSLLPHRKTRSPHATPNSAIILRPSLSILARSLPCV